MNDTDKRLADRIKGIRLLHNMSQIDMARKVGVSRTTIYNIERGGNTDISTIRKIEEALGVTLY